jgi:hypothetical protein
VTIASLDGTKDTLEAAIGEFIGAEISMMPRLQHHQQMIWVSPQEQTFPEAGVEDPLAKRNLCHLDGCAVRRESTPYVMASLYNIELRVPASDGMACQIASIGPPKAF